MDPTHNFISLGFAAALAFVTAAAVVALDCWRQNSAEFSYSTHPVLLDAVGLAFCSACGFIAVSAFLYIESNHSSWIAKLIPISADSPFAGALVVGVSVMVIIRSKIFQLGKDSGDFGLEFLYQLAREGVLARLRRRRANEKGRFVVAAMPKIAGMANFAEELDNRLRDLLRDKRLETYRKERGAIAPPDRGFAAADPLWNIYYKTLLRNAVDFAGIGPIEEWLVTL